MSTSGAHDPHGPLRTNTTQQEEITNYVGHGQENVNDVKYLGRLCAGNDFGSKF